MWQIIGTEEKAITEKGKKMEASRHAPGACPVV